MKPHILKITPKWYEAALHGKRFEVRKSDRDFKEGDHIILCEWDGKEFTGREIRGIIDYVLTSEDFPDGIEEGYCVFAYSIRPYGVQDWREDE